MPDRLVGVGTFRNSPEIEQEVLEVLRNERLSYGPVSMRFEREFSALHDSRFGVLSNSGTSSLQVALQALKELHGWNDGDEIIIPALTFVATANVVFHNRMMPVLVDVEPNYYGIHPALIERAITPKTRAIIPVHLFGQPCDMTAVNEIARRHNLKVIEDSCECMFVKHAGVSAGALGDIGCFSTYIAHILTTGVGGIATTNNPEYAIKMRSLVNHGRDSIYLSIDDDDNLGPERLPQVIGRRFKFQSIGHSFRVTELEAALGVAQLPNWQYMIEARNRNAAYLIENLSPLADRLQLLGNRPDTEHAWMMFPIVLKNQGKGELVNFLESRGVETRDMLPLTNQPVYRGWIQEEDYPVADWINKSGFYVACHQDLTPDDLAYMVAMIYEYFKA